MTRITEISLPGVGVRQEFTASNGTRVSVVSHRGGRREVSVGTARDPDASRTVLDLDAEDTAALASILGAPQVAASVTAMLRLEGLALDWLPVEAGADGTSIGDGHYRDQTGASIVAVIRGDESHPAPGPEFALADGDVAVSVGTPEALDQLRTLLRG